MGTYVASVAPFEAQLMERVKAREDGAFTELFKTFSGKIYRTALRILREEQAAEDALQETLINIYRAAHKFRGDSKIGTWVNRITINVCLEMVRKNKKHNQRTDEDVSTQTNLTDLGTKTPYQIAAGSELQRRVLEALGRLSDKHGPVVRMHDMEGYTIREIADRLGVAEGTIKSRLFYGRKELRAKLKKVA